MSVQLKIDFEKPIQNNFRGNNAVYHCYAGMPDNAGRVYSEALCELEADRAAAIGVRVARTFYKWYAWDAEKQCWDWENQHMQVVYRWLERMKKRGIQVALQIGWCSPGDVNGTSWNKNSPFAVADNWEQSVQNFADWASENLYQLVQVRGFDNIKYLELFTEPQRNSGKLPEGKSAYEVWADCAVAVHQALLRDGRRSWVQLIGPNEGSTTTSLMNKWVAEHCNEVIDIYSSHNYQDFVADEAMDEQQTGQGIFLYTAGSRIQQQVTLEPDTNYTVEFEVTPKITDQLHVSGCVLFGAWTVGGGETRDPFTIAAGGSPTNRLNKTAVKMADAACLKNNQVNLLSHQFCSGRSRKANIALFSDIKSLGKGDMFGAGEGANTLFAHAARLYKTGDKTKTNLLQSGDLNAVPGGQLIISGSVPPEEFKNWWHVCAARKACNDPYYFIKECVQTALNYVPKDKEYWFDEYNVRNERYEFDKPVHGTHLAALMVALMNSGANSSFMWTLFDQQWPNNHTNNDDGFVDGDHRYGVMPVLTRSIVPYPAFYAVALMMRLMGGEKGTTVYGDDGARMLSATVSVMPDGNISVAVVNNKSLPENFSLQFSKTLDVRLKRRLYNPEKIQPNEKAELIQPDCEFECGDTITDLLPANSLVVYSTL